MIDWFSLSYEFGANNGIPFLNITVNDNTSNMLSFLNTDTITIINAMRDISGVAIVFFCVYKIITGIPAVLDGDLKNDSK